MQFLPEQKQAIETLDKNICVSAGAGSGKTSVLTERFIYILQAEQQNDPEFSADNILTLTFSEEAANEMKRRIAEGLEKRGLADMVPELEKAYVSTIHAFCNRLLRENVFEAGLDPEFEVLDGVEAGFMLSQNLEELFQKLFASKDADFLDLLSVYSVDELKVSILDIYDKAGSFDLDIDKLLPPPVAFDDTIAELNNCLDILASGRGFQMSEAIKKRMVIVETEIKPAVKDIVRAGLEPAPSDIFDLLTNLKSKLDKRPTDPVYKETVDEYRNLIDKLQSIVIENIARPYARSFQNLLVCFTQAVDQYKKANSLLDFDSLQTETIKLLRLHPDVLEHYQDQFRYILIDEYQDTNCLQDHLADLLSARSRLFVVGDRQQAIYGFRNADDRLLLQKENCYSAADDSMVIRLQTNFRSTEQVLGGINYLFDGLWKENGNTFQPLKAVRKHSSISPAVKMLQLPEESRGAADRRFAEAGNIVKEITCFIDQGEVNERKAQYGDIAILLRALSDLEIYEYALKSAGIPYTIVRSGNFYNQQEIKDVHNFIKSLLDPFDNFTLAEVLKSPLGAISDNALFWLIDNAERSLYFGLKQLETIRGMTEADRNKLVLFRTVFNEAIREKSRMAPAELIIFIIRQTEFRNYLYMQDRGAEKAGNIDKLINIALKYSRNNSGGILEFSNYLQKLMDEGVKESELTIAADSENSVKILTVHKAKGLEFPIVFIPDLERGTVQKNSRPFNLTTGGRLGCKLNGEKSYTYLDNEQQITAKETEEAKRLFYVACTRARDHLVFVGTKPADEKTAGKKSPCWGDWVSLYADTAGADIQSLSEAGFKSAGSSQTILDKYKDSFMELKSIDAAVTGTDAETVFQRILNRARPIPSSPEQALTLSVTQLIKFQQCPRYYFWRYVRGVGDFWLQGTGIREQGSEEFFEEDEDIEIFSDEQTVSSADYGSIVHSVLEHYDFGRTLEEQWPGILEQAAALSESQVTNLRKMLEDFLRSDIAQMIKNGAAVQKEISFLIPVGQHLLKGKLDLLITTKDGQHIVVDYKTGSFNAADPEAGLAKHGYDVQQQLYALAVQQITGSLPQKTIVYFMQNSRAVEVPVSEDILNKQRESIKEVFENIAANSFTGADDEEKCGECIYQTLCAGQPRRNPAGPKPEAQLVSSS
ncbi:MAG: UvrD-helicase domain-containing protein [Candidatus Margulisiibacteriota bacterium]